MTMRNRFEQENAWRLLLGELSEDFSREEIELHKVEIKKYVARLIECGKPEEKSPSPGFSSKSMQNEETFSGSSDDFVAEEKPIGVALPEPTKWPPGPTVQSADASDTSTTAERLDRDAATCAHKADYEELPESLSADHVDKPNSRKSNSPSGSSGSEQRVISTIEDLFPPIISHLQDKSTGKSVSVGININFDYCQVAAYDELKREAFVLENEHGLWRYPYVASIQDWK